MNIEVMSRSKFKKYASENHNKTSIVISISSHGEQAPFVVCSHTNKIVNILNIMCNDTDRQEEQYGGMTNYIALHIARFIKDNYNNAIDKIIVHCDAGQSRSAGVAAAILKYYTNDDTQIFNNSKYTPNMLCYRKVLEALMCGG